MKCDVVIVGSGMAGAIMAAILARNGVSVVLLDHQQHPKFAIGESTIPGTSYLLRIMADRFGVPELERCSTFFTLRQGVTASSGIKRNFSFVHHRRGESLDPRHSTMLPVPHYPHGPESHLFRQDVDAYLFSVAVKYGTKAIVPARIQDVHEVPGGMNVALQSGEVIEAKYVVDASGYQSVLAKKYNLREEPTRLRSQSRSLFTHMVGVKHFDELYDPGSHGLPQPLSQGTLHHIFDGGWLWVIPFNNHAGATNNLCSVGLQLDPRRWPHDGTPAEVEFASFLRDFPDIARQFTGARSVRPWVSTQRLQYSSKRVMGPRFCLLAHAAGFVDPLFSRGLYITMETINALSSCLLDAVRTDNFDDAEFEPLERLTQGLIDAHDRVVHGSFIAFRNFELWNAWYRVWALGGTLSSLRFRTAHLMYKKTRDKRYLDDLQNHRNVGSLAADLDEYHELFNTAYAIMCDCEAGKLTSEEAAAAIYRQYEGKAWIPPMYGLDDPQRRFISRGDFLSFLKSNVWGYLISPQTIRDKYFRVPPNLIAKRLSTVRQREQSWLRHLRTSYSYPTFQRWT